MSRVALARLSKEESEYDSDEEESEDESGCSKVRSWNKYFCITMEEDKKEGDKEDELDEDEEKKEDVDDSESVSFGKDTVDACICGIHHFFAGDINWSDSVAFVIAFALYIAALALKIGTAVMLKIYNSYPLELAFRNAHATLFPTPGALSATGALLPQPTILMQTTACSQHGNGTDGSHEIVLFVWFAFLVPEFTKMTTKIHVLWSLPTEDPPTKDKAKDQTKDKAKGKAPSVMDPLKAKGKDKADKTALTLDANKAKCKVSKDKKDDKGGKEAWGKNWLADYEKPKEDKKVGVEIKSMSRLMKLVILISCTIPNVLIFLYVAWVGIGVIWYSAAILPVLIVKALILKIVLMLPGQILGALGSNYLKKYVGASSFKLVMNNGQQNLRDCMDEDYDEKNLPGVWFAWVELWLGPLCLVLLLIGGVSLVHHGNPFLVATEVRAHCHALFPLGATSGGPTSCPLHNIVGVDSSCSR